MIMIAAAPPQSALPPEVRSFLGAFVARRRWLALLRAAGWAIAFAVFWLSVICALDRFFALGRIIRGELLADIAVGILILLGPAIARLFRRRIDWSAAAAQIESRGGEFGGRLLTITSQMLSEPVYRGSEQLLASVRRDLGADLRRRRPASLAPLRAATWPWAVALAALLIFAALAAIPWLQMPRLLARALEPWAAWPPVTTTSLRVDPGNARIRQGTDLTITVHATRLGDNPPLLSLSSDDGRTWQTQPMAAASDHFELALGAVQTDLQYFIEGGDARTDRFTIHVLRPPAVTQFRIHYTYPAYTAKPPVTVTNTDGLIEAPVGSTASLEALCTEPLVSAILLVGGRPIPMSPTAQPNACQCDLPIERDVKLELQLVGREISGNGPATMAIHAVPDLPPVVKFIQPTQDLRLGPRDTLPITCLATDDYGVTSTALRVQVNLGSILLIPMRLDGPSRYRRGSLSLDLGALGVKSGDLVRLSLAASDSGGHEQIGDEERFILISSRGVAPTARMSIAEMQRAARLADALADNVEAAAKSLQEARDRAGGDVRDPEALAPARQNLASAADAAEALRQTMLPAIAHSDSPQLATALCRWIDDAAVLGGAVDRAADRLDGPKQGDLPQRLQPVAARARQLHEDLDTLARGDLAAAVRTQSGDVIAPSAQADVSRKVAQRLDQQIHDDAAKLGLDPGAADFPDRLAALTAREKDLLSQQHAIDYARVADSWSRRLQQGNAPDSDMAARLNLGAQAESLRPDANLVRARDLAMAAAAAPAMVNGPAAAQRDQFAPALAAMQRDQAETSPSDAIRAQADAARAKMSAWGAIAHNPGAATQPADRNAMDLAMQSNQQMARHDYAAAEKTDQALAAAAATRPSATIARAMDAAQSIDQIRREQDELAAQTAAASAEQNGQLADRQAAIARAIKQQDNRADAADRSAALSAISAASARLSQMPQQLSEALAAAAAHRKAAQQTAVAARALAAATQPSDQAVAAAALQQAKLNQAQADQRQADAAKDVDPSAAQAMSQSLKSSAAADDAAAIIARQLTPGLQQLRQALDASDAAGVDRATASAAAAVATAQDRLTDAKGQAMRGDPLGAAHFFARSAADKLSAGADRRAVASDQQSASLALAQAWQQAAHGAAMARLAQVPAIGAVLNPLRPDLTDTAGAQPGTAWSVDSMPAMRQWGRMQDRPLGSLSTSVNQNDPAGYEESLKAYFDVLNRSVTAGQQQ
jgi:hypothetical protein